MNKLKIFSIAFLTATAISNAQDLDLAKKVLDAEQYEKAKLMLKTIIQAKPDNGKANFLLGTIYLKQNIEDSASIFFQKGLVSIDGARFNTIGLGQLDLESGNVSAAHAKFDQVMKGMRKKDVEEYVYIAQAYMNNSKPDYKSAISLLNKARLINPNDANVMLALGDAFYGDKNQNDAYASYRDAYAADNSLIRAKMQLGVLLKGAKAYTEALKAYDEVITLNANYGPVYRELAETYYLWASNKPATYTENIAKALSNYEKYMSLTDYSITSRMRHADFLVLAKDYKALELEANKMKELDKVNPRIMRYLGYAAYQNGNPDAAISALTDYTTKGSNKIIAGDYYYLGLAKVAKSVATDGKTVDSTMLASGTLDLKKALDMDIVMANGLNEIGKKYFSQKLYNLASALFELAITNPNSRNYLEDNVYYGLSVLTINRAKDVKDIDPIALAKADVAMDNVITATPNYQEAYLYKARINSTLDKDDVMAATYQKYLDIVIAKGDDEINKNKAKLTESYNSIAAFYANTDKVKAKEYFAKTLALDPTNTYALDSLKILK
jgi:cytochrome c-type biogenesis protein CcmH/NrfG